MLKTAKIIKNLKKEIKDLMDQLPILSKEYSDKISQIIKKDYEKSNILITQSKDEPNFSGIYQNFLNTEKEQAKAWEDQFTKKAEIFSKLKSIMNRAENESPAILTEILAYHKQYQRKISKKMNKFIFTLLKQNDFIK